jgi:hypothetical protein
LRLISVFIVAGYLGGCGSSSGSRTEMPGLSANDVTSTFARRGLFLAPIDLGPNFPFCLYVVHGPSGDPELAALAVFDSDEEAQRGGGPDSNPSDFPARATRVRNVVAWTAVAAPQRDVALVAAAMGDLGTAG